MSRGPDKRPPRLMTEAAQSYSFTRRAVALGAAQGLVGAALIGRMAWLSVAENEHYSAMSESNLMGEKELSMPQSGTVKFFNHAKGFGFITPDDGNKDVFVHISAVQASGLPGLNDGQKVTFDTEPDQRGKGPKAVNLSVG